MAGKYSVGPSSYGDLRKVEQFVSTARIALQVLSVIADFNAWQKARGAVGSLSVNEGMRSRARQTYLWLNRFILAIVVALPFTSRHDEVLHGNAIDFGITMPDGSNRALTATEFSKLHELVEARGGTWTGRNFGEPWHHEMATRTEMLAPYPHVTPSNTTPPASAAEIAHRLTTGESMTENIKVNGKYQFTVGLEYIHWHSSTAESDVSRKTMSTTDEQHTMTRADAEKLCDSLGIPIRFLDVDTLKKVGWRNTWSRQLEIQGAIKDVVGIKQLAAAMTGAK